VIRISPYALRPTLYAVLTALFILPWRTSMAEVQPVNLGTPVRSMTIWGRMLVEEGDTGKPILYAGNYTGAGNSRLIRYDYTSGVRYYELPGTKGAYGLALGRDGMIYVGTVDAARFFRFNPQTEKVTDLGTPAPSESYIWTLDVGPDGRIYGATYPNAKVLEYDPATGSMRDHGRMHPTEQYCRDLAVADNGRIFCGIGSHADVIAYDPATGERL